MRVLYGLLGLFMVCGVEGSEQGSPLHAGTPVRQRVRTSVALPDDSAIDSMTQLRAKQEATRLLRAIEDRPYTASEIDPSMQSMTQLQAKNAVRELANSIRAGSQESSPVLLRSRSMRVDKTDDPAASPGGAALQQQLQKAKLETSLTTAGFSGFNYSGASVTAQLDGAAAAPIGATVVQLKADAAFAGTPAAIELQQLMALADPATMQATVQQRIRDFGASLAGYNLDTNAQKAGVTDRPTSNTAQALLDWLAPKVSAAMRTKIAAPAVGSGVQGLLDFRNSVFVLLSNGALVDGKPDRGVQRLLKPLCTHVGQVNPLLSGERLPTLSIQEFTKLLANYVAFGR